MKIDLGTLEELLYQNLDQNKAKELVQKITKVEEELKEQTKEDKIPKQKNQFVVIEFDGTGTAGIVQIPQDDDVNTVLGRISDSIREYNQTKAGKKRSVKNIVDSFSMVKRKIFKSKNLTVKTKYPVQIISSNNILV